jgi:hypothetical protein
LHFGSWWYDFTEEQKAYHAYSDEIVRPKCRNNPVKCEVPLF